jgi:hypothetical protein
MKMKNYVYCNTNMFLDIIHHPVFIYNIMFQRLDCLQVKPTQLGPISTANPHLQIIKIRIKTGWWLQWRITFKKF